MTNIMSPREERSKAGGCGKPHAASAMSPHFSQPFVARQPRVAWMRGARRFRGEGIVDTYQALRLQQRELATAADRIRAAGARDSKALSRTTAILKRVSAMTILEAADW